MLRKRIVSFIEAEEAATTVEYAIMITLIVLAVSQTVVTLGTTALEVFNTTAGAIP